MVAGKCLPFVLVEDRDFRRVWWKANCLAYPRLAEVARDYLAIPATGAPVERVFSGGADMVSPKRGCLAADTIRASLCLKEWQRFSG